ncbi:NAD(P)-dependent alcohol dehydrogenase [Devosia sp. SL43]|uniref:NAD(P)-dependent alcohol dehydrogenase n=1 Tax=Devosia sp. SL43 TaxID=2806348 RepID=UPI001F33C13F|nr:NAD(P)-dependent alcohol dehydrogenase [Devosia sp. SL43]UJW86757.1 NAD(P)-dependent alcohol dehydrogenase [Devosia sp. SL43]
MQAAHLTRYGGPDAIDVCEVPRPVPKANEVLVQVHAASLTLPDLAMRKADPFIIRFFSGLLRPKNPVLGDSFSGVVAGVGSAVTRFAIGDLVFGSTAVGTHAQYIALPEDSAMVHKPARIAHAEAAGLSYSYLTAMPFLRDEGKVKPGDRVLINGGSSSIGLVAIQLARHFGADVTAVCSGRNVELVRAQGAGDVIDYTRADFTKSTSAYDVIFDVVGKSSFGRCRDALKTNGIYLTTVPTLGILLTMLTTGKGPKRGKMATTGLRPIADKLSDLKVLVGLIEAGAVHGVIDRRYRLDQIADAHRYVETERKAGDVVIELVPAGTA